MVDDVHPYIHVYLNLSFVCVGRFFCMYMYINVYMILTTILIYFILDHLCIYLYSYFCFYFLIVIFLVTKKVCPRICRSRTINLTRPLQPRQKINELTWTTNDHFHFHVSLFLFFRRSVTSLCIYFLFFSLSS